ncbi:hypothetical protein Tco_0465095 [Tanacetum coccineum]
MPLELESPEPYTKPQFIKKLFVITPKIDMFKTKFKTPPDSPPVTVIDPDDQPMWLSTRTVAPTPSSAIIQLPISNNFIIKADFVEISNLFQYGKNQEEAIMLRTFPVSLSGEAKTWMNELDEGTITSWNELREAFINCTVHIPYMNAKTFADDVLLNNVGDKELKSIDSVGTGKIT